MPFEFILHDKSAIYEYVLSSNYIFKYTIPWFCILLTCEYNFAGYPSPLNFIIYRKNDYYRVMA